MRCLVWAFVAALSLPTLILAAHGSNPDVSGCPNLPGAPILTVPVRVMTQELKTVQGLQASDFALTVNRLPHEICGFAHVRQPLSAGILLDTSGSMRGNAMDGLALARRGIDQFLDTSEPQDEYFLEIVNTGPEMQCVFGCDLARLRAGLRAVPKGRTALVDAMYLALNAMRKARHQNRCLLVFSDGCDNASVYRPQELARAFADSPIPIFLVIPWEPQRQTPHLPEEVAARTELVRLVNQSGGYARGVSDQRQMTAAVEELASAMRSPYVLSFMSPPSLHISYLRVDVKGLRRPLVLYRAVEGARLR